MGVAIWNGARALMSGDGFGLFYSGVDLVFGVGGFVGCTLGAVGAFAYGGTSAVLEYVPGIYGRIITPLVVKACGFSTSC